MRRAVAGGFALPLVVALAGCGGGSRAATPSAAASLPPGLAGRPAPRVRLADARGGQLDTRKLRGRPYLVTFLYTRCPDVCPLIGAEIQAALKRLGPDAHRVAAVAISVDPAHDTPAAVRDWLHRHREPSEFHYILGSEKALAPVWKAWFAAPQIPGDPRSAHTAAIWLVDRSGRLAGKLDGSSYDSDTLATQLRRLL